MISRFLSDDSGAVTIDWVALTAGLLLLSIALVYGIFDSGVDPLASDISDALSAIQTVSTGDAPNLTD
ncbi:MAG: hypothetical protein AAF501_06740 [Pseudomonadota bacterium]